jgi:hypothetical protein
MKKDKSLNSRLITFFFLALFSFNSRFETEAQQKIGFGLHFDPVISWFSSDIKEIKNQGARPGYNFGLTYNKYFAPNYSFSAGISLLNAGGRLTSSDTTILEFSNFKYKLTKVLPEQAIIYKIRYLAFPVGLKLQTNQIGYITFYSDVGFDPKIVIGGKIDVPSLDISGEDAMNELRTFNFSYHVAGGIEYSLGGTTALVFGLNFDNNFLDITKDTGKQPVDKISHKILTFRIGVNF